MSAFITLILTFIAALFIGLGTVIVTVSTPNTPIQWAYFTVGILMVILPLWQIAPPIIQAIHSRWSRWVESNQMDEVPAVHLGYNPLPSRKEDLEVLLANKQEELNRALARGLVFKTKVEAKMAWASRIHEAEVNELFFKVQDLSEKLDKKHDQLMISEYDLDRARAALRRTADERDNLEIQIKKLEKQLAVYRLLNWADKTHAGQIK